MPTDIDALIRLLEAAQRCGVSTIEIRGDGGIVAKLDVQTHAGRVSLAQGLDAAGLISSDSVGTVMGQEEEPERRGASVDTIPAHDDDVDELAEVLDIAHLD